MITPQEILAIFGIISAILLAVKGMVRIIIEIIELTPRAARALKDAYLIFKGKLNGKHTEIK